MKRSPVREIVLSKEHLAFITVTACDPPSPSLHTRKNEEMVIVSHHYASGYGMSLSIGRLKMKNKGSSSWARLFRTGELYITSMH